MAQLYEIVALVQYAVVIFADSKEQALKEVETWENAWHDTGELVGVSDVEVADVRDGVVQDAHHSAIAESEEH
jgi:hypothetical protein